MSPRTNVTGPKFHVNIPQVQFAGKAVPIAGIVGGVVIAVGGPWVILHEGQQLDKATLTHLLYASVILGGVVAAIGAFFGTVIPTSVHDPHD